MSPGGFSVAVQRIERSDVEDDADDHQPDVFVLELSERHRKGGYHDNEAGQQELEPNDAEDLLDEPRVYRLEPKITVHVLDIIVFAASFGGKLLRGFFKISLVLI